MDAVTLASKLSLTGMAVRQHLYELQKQEVVEYEEEARPIGRPAKVWRLTALANRWFPNGYLQLSVDLLHSVRATFGDEGLGRVLEDLKHNQIIKYREHLSDADSLRDRLQKLVMIRMNEGYFPEIQEQEDGSFLFVQKHCPIAEAVAVSSRFTDNELELFQSVLGDHVTIERVEYLLSDGPSYAYRITDKQGL